MKSMNWSFSLPSFLKMIIYEKLFTWDSVKDECIYYKTLSLIKDLYFIISVTNDPTSFRFSHNFFDFDFFCYISFLDIFVFISILLISKHIDTYRYLSTIFPSLGLSFLITSKSKLCNINYVWMSYVWSIFCVHGLIIGWYVYIPKSFYNCFDCYGCCSIL